MDWQPGVLEAVETLSRRNAPCLRAFAVEVLHKRWEMDTNSKVGGCGKQDSVAKHDGQPGTLLRSTTVSQEFCWCSSHQKKKGVGSEDLVNKEALKVNLVGILKNIL